MANITRWNPLNWWDDDTFNEIERYLNRPASRRMMRWNNAAVLHMPLDVLEKEDAYIVEASIPGIDPDDLEISFNDNVLSIRGRTTRDEEHDGHRYVVRERRFGEFSRTLTFPVAVDGEGIQADYDNGELTLRIPKDKNNRTRHINITRSDGRIRGVGVKPDSEGWVEGQATSPNRPSTEANRNRQRWTEGQASDPAEIGRKESAGWVEGQQSNPGSGAPDSEGWIEGEKVMSD